MRFFIVIIALLVALIWFLVHVLVPPPIRWVFSIALDLLFLLWIIWGIAKMIKNFGFFGSIKLIVRAIIWLVLIGFVMMLPSMIVRIIFIELS